MVRELWANRARTFLVVASIAVGIFAVGTVQHLRTVILSEMQQVYDKSNASVATLYVAGVDDDAVEAIRRMPGIADAQGRSNLSVKVQVGVDKWENFLITAIHDFDDIRINLIKPDYTVKGHADFGAEQTRGLARKRSSLNVVAWTLAVHCPLVSKWATHSILRPTTANIVLSK